VPTFTLPKTRLDALRLSPGAEAPSCRPKVSVTPPTLAVNVAACTVITGETVAVKSTLVAPAGMVTEDGTATALLVLARLTPRPLLPAAAFSVTVQRSVPAPVIELLVQFSALSTGTPVPVSSTVVDDPGSALLATVNSPVAVPVAAGLNWMVNVTLLFAPTVIGKLLWPLRVKDWPLKPS
jgi:hypothetical protein